MWLTIMKVEIDIDIDKRHCLVTSALGKFLSFFGAFSDAFDLQPSQMPGTMLLLHGVSKLL